MSLQEKWRRFWRRGVGNSVGGAAGGRVARALRRSPERLPSDATATTNTEQLIGTTVVTSALRHDIASEAALHEGQDAVVTAAGDAVIAVADAERDQDERTRRSRLRRSAEQDRRQDETLGAPVDHAAPLVSRRVVAVAEVVLAVVESGFWYIVFSDDIDRRVPLLSPQRAAAVGLALFIPLLGVLAARLAGPAWQRYLRYPLQDRRQRRSQTAAALLGLVMVATAGVAAWFLVSWRYSTSNPSNTFSVLPPAWCMALLFVGSVVMLALLRAFSDSEQHAVNKARDEAVAADQAARKQVHDRVVRALVAWVAAWTALRQLVNVGLDEAERVVATGEHILLHHRGLFADAPLPTLRTAEAPGDGSTADEAGLRYHLDTNLMTTRLRVHASALQTLADYLPPTVRPDGSLLKGFPTSAAEDVKNLNQRITALLGALRVPGTPAAAGDPTPEPTAPEPTAPEPTAEQLPVHQPNVVPTDVFRTEIPETSGTRMNGHDRAGSPS